MIRATSSALASALAPAVALAIALAACTSGGSPTPASSTRSTSTDAVSQGTSASSDRSSSAATRVRWNKVVVVVLENHSYSDIIGNRNAPFLNTLAARGASFSRAYATTHPSEPNYLALFSGSTHGLTSDLCPLRYASANLASELRAAGHDVVGFSEGLPRTGWTGCTSGAYARKHAPWIDFANLPASVNRSMHAFPSNPASLPDLSFVIPDLNHDMHDGTIAAGDHWVRTHLSRFATWASAHRSLLIITWDEDDRSANNRIPTLAVGAGVHRGVSRTRINHYRLLRTLEDGFGVRALGQAARVHAITELSN